MNPSTIEIIGTVIFGVAVFHTFLVSKFQHLAHTFPEGSVAREFFHFFGEVEAVFGMWAYTFMGIYAFMHGVSVYDEHHKVIGGAVHYMQSLNFTEPAFVFVIMVMAGTRPIIYFSEKLIILFTKVIFLPKKMAFYISALILGPLLGSFITEPAAMTVTALILLDYFYSGEMSKKFKYATLGLLFVNISIGGTLTNFAAPPVLMVAGKWGWGIPQMLGMFGWKAAISVVIGTNLVAFAFRNELKGELKDKRKHEADMEPTWWIVGISLLLLGITVYFAHYLVIFMGNFLLFLGFAAVTKEYQDELKLTSSLLVGFFLAGLVTMGNIQAWWIAPLLGKLGDIPLYIGATGLTAITDNAALTYLGSLVEGLSDSKKYYLVAGAVTGGGLTVIANAPNPAGFGILKGSFGEDGINPGGLLIAALPPTLLALLLFRILPSF
jgi:hypothetical protein